MLLTTAFSMGVNSGYDKLIKDMQIENITWNKPVQINNQTIIIGKIRKDISLAWVINQKKRYKLTVFDISKNIAQYKNFEKLLFLIDGDCVYLFKEVNEKQNFVSLKLITCVSYKNIFEVVETNNNLIPNNNEKVVHTINWGKTFHRNGSTYVEGATKISIGTLNIYWRKDVHNTINLISIIMPGAGELPSEEKRLFVWCSNEYCYIMDEILGQLNSNIDSYLHLLDIVTTDNLKSGFDLVIK